MIAPYWDDIILIGTGIVEYGIVTSANGSNVINEVETFLSLSQNIDVKLDWVFVAKWVNVCLFGNSNCAQVIRHILYFKTFVTIVLLQTDTFQVVIASRGTTSFAIFTYKCNLLQWTRFNAAIGYSAGPDNFANHPLSRTSKVINIDCLNYPSSVWSNVVYNLNEGTS